MAIIYIHPKITRPNRYYRYLMMSRASVLFPDSQLTHLREQISAPLDQTILFYQQQLVAGHDYIGNSWHRQAKEATFDYVVDLRHVPPSPDSIKGLLSYMINDMDHYLLSSWFDEDMTTAMAGRDKRRRCDFRKELKAKVNAIHDPNWRTHATINNQQSLIGAV